VRRQGGYAVRGHSGTPWLEQIATALEALPALLPEAAPAQRGDAAPIVTIGRNCHRANDNSAEGENHQNALQNSDSREREGLLSDCHGISYRFAVKRNGDRIAEPGTQATPSESGAIYGAELSGIHRNLSVFPESSVPNDDNPEYAKKPCKMAHYRKQALTKRENHP